MDRWTRLRSFAALVCICRAARSGLVSHGPRHTPHARVLCWGSAGAARLCRGVSGGWCAAQGGPCAAVRAVRGQTGVSRGENARPAHAVAALRSRLVPPPRPRAWGTHCFLCATPHSPAHFVGCAAREAGAGSWVRKGSRARAAQVAVDHRCASPCVRAIVGLTGVSGERRAPWSPSGESAERRRGSAASRGRLVWLSPRPR